MNHLYERLSSDPRAILRVASFNRAATIIGYVAYPLLLVLLAIFDISALALRIAVPASGFMIVSLFRYIYNEPRPYEADPSRPPLIPKTTKGKSYPSRHTFCMFMIAFCWLSWIPWGVAPGCLLSILAIGMAVSRVALGVHYPKDVIAGFVAAVLFSLLGYLLF